MQQMAAAGMEFGTVAHFGDNQAARRLYQVCGCKPWHLLDGYKNISSFTGGIEPAFYRSKTSSLISFS
jgi:RimJ/RimL family protein N-acetyltransferase